MNKTKLFSRLEKLDAPREGVAVVCVETDELGEAVLLWQVPNFRPAQRVTITIPSGGKDPIILIQDIG